jgi:hypothetical protein
MSGHPTKPTPIRGRLVPVDIRIAPVVEWMNGYPGVETLFSCQGDSRRKGYVLFRCSDNDSLIAICRKLVVPLNSMTSIQLGFVVVDELDGSLRYEIEFPKPQNLSYFLGHLKGYKGLAGGLMNLWKKHHPNVELETAPYPNIWLLHHR